MEFTNQISSYFLVVILAFFCSSTLFVKAQDSIRIDSDLKIETKGQQVFAAFVEDMSCINCPLGNVLDNPFHHFAVYTGFNHTLTLDHKYSLQTGLYLEERSHSGGNNTLDNLVVFPKILFEAKDTFSFLPKNLTTRILGGDFWDEDVDDILRFYNIDYQAFRLSVQYGKLSFNYMTIGDLSRNIGLDLPQTHHYTIGYNHKNWLNKVSVVANYLLPTPFGNHDTDQDFNLSNYTKVNISERLYFQGQIDARINPLFPVSLASVIRTVYKKDDLRFTAAIRYYNERFNQGYAGTLPTYTNRRPGTFIGPQLYPLKNYFRPLSQWAFYTHQNMKDILALEFTSEYEEQLFDRLSYFHQLDLNALFDIESQTTIFIPFYNVGVKAKFTRLFEGFISATNKHMEINRDYQTFSASQKPFLSVGVNVNFEDRLATRYAAK